MGYFILCNFITIKMSKQPLPQTAYVFCYRLVTTFPSIPREEWMKDWKLMGVCQRVSHLLHCPPKGSQLPAPGGCMGAGSGLSNSCLATASCRYIVLLSSSIRCKRNSLSRFLPTLVSSLGKRITDSSGALLAILGSAVQSPRSLGE